MSHEGRERGQEGRERGHLGQRERAGTERDRGTVLLSSSYLVEAGDDHLVEAGDDIRHRSPEARPAEWPTY